jgi:ElaA protein
LFTNLNGLLLMTLQESSAHWFVREFDQLASSQLYAILAARVAVFVVEQDCPYQDIDGLDEIAIHVWAESPEGKLLAYARILPPGRRFAEPAIGRVLTTAAGRGLGIGRALMRRSLVETERRFPGQAIRISAQQYLERFYAGLGFETVSEPYLEDDIPHLEMLRPAGAA